ncbi:glutamine-hydrolyzing GMP synthase-like protein [Tanacetum coccineum]
MSHGDEVFKMPNGFEVMVTSEHGAFEHLECAGRWFYGFQYHSQGCDVPAKELDILLVLLADTKRKPEQEQYSLTKSNERYGDETEDGDIPLAEVSSDTKATWKNAWHIEYQRMLNLMVVLLALRLLERMLAFGGLMIVLLRGRNLELGLRDTYLRHNLANDQRLESLLDLDCMASSQSREAIDAGSAELTPLCAAIVPNFHLPMHSYEVKNMYLMALLNLSARIANAERKQVDGHRIIAFGAAWRCADSG